MGRLQCFMDRLEEATQLIQKAQISQALEILKPLYESDQSLAHSLAYSHCLIETGQTQTAKSVLDHALDRWKQQPQLQHNLGYLYMRQEKWEEALQVYQRLATSGQISESSLWNLGLCYMRLNRFEEAEKVFTRNIEQHPDTIESKVDLSICLFRKKDLTASQKLLEEVLALQNQHPRAKALMYEIEKDARGKSARHFKKDV